MGGEVLDGLVRVFGGVKSIALIIYFTSLNKTDNVPKLSRWCTDPCTLQYYYTRGETSFDVMGGGNHLAERFRYCHIIHHRHTLEEGLQLFSLLAEQLIVGLY